MNIDLDLSWPVVRHKRFEIIVNMFDYVCDNWANAIVYKDRHTKQWLGFVTKHGEFRVRPELCPASPRVAVPGRHRSQWQTAHLIIRPPRRSLACVR